MSTEILEIRPRFKRLSKESVDDLLEKVKGILDNHENLVIGSIVHHHATLKIPVDQRHFWSPQLSLNFEETEEGTEIRGLYGPKPDVWLMFMFIYFFLGFAALVVLIVGLSRYNLGLPHYILWFFPFVLGGIVTLWFSGKAGKKLGKDQIYQIHNLVRPAILANAENIED